MAYLVDKLSSTCCNPASLLERFPNGCVLGTTVAKSARGLEKARAILHTLFTLHLYFYKHV